MGFIYSSNAFIISDDDTRSAFTPPPDSFNRNILTGIQGSIGLYVRAAIETVRNDELRKLFMDYLKEELSMYKNFVKYGKVKGWIKIVPTYHEN